VSAPIERWLAQRWTDPHDHQRQQEPELWLLVWIALLLTVLIMVCLASARSL